MRKSPGFDETLRLLETDRFDALRYSATCLRDSFNYVQHHVSGEDV